jgi:N6-adenosine-specific RNA methylase IME4
MMTSASIFAPLPMIAGGWPCIAMDAPLHFRTRSAKGQGRSPSRHYRTYSPAEIMTLRVSEIAARNAWCFIWWPDPHVLMLPDMLKAFGFMFSAKAFTWVKTQKQPAHGTRLVSTREIESVLTMGGGYTTRKNSESCWLGRRGKPEILSHAVREVIVAPRREHSRKPSEFYARVEAFCPGPRLDLFGRQSRPQWTVYGDEATLFDVAV